MSRTSANVYRFGSTKENITHVVRPLTMYIENLEEGPFTRSVWALHRPTKATASAAHQNTGPLTTLQIAFEKLELFQCCGSRMKKITPTHTYITHTRTHTTMPKHTLLNLCSVVAAHHWKLEFACVISHNSTSTWEYLYTLIIQTIEQKH